MICGIQLFEVSVGDSGLRRNDGCGAGMTVKVSFSRVAKPKNGPLYYLGVY